MEQPQALMHSQNLSTILDENFSPVARARLFSRGVQPNNRLSKYEETRCDRGCLACGNCIDACPVVREKQRFQFAQNRRTSMSLETIVGDECRRCYRCVKACPQVSKDTKEYVFGFRRREKFIHAALATLIFTLMVTGIFIYHFGEAVHDLNAVDYAIFRFLHWTAGAAIIFVPILYLIMDRAHFLRQLRNAWKFGGEEDVAWWTQMKTFFRHPLRSPLPLWKEFNPYHKAWICWLCIALPILMVTGIFNFIAPYPTHPVQGMLAWRYGGGDIWMVNAGIHALVALCTDLMIILHLYIKLLRFLFRNIGDMVRCWSKTRNFHYPFLYADKEVEVQRTYQSH